MQNKLNVEKAKHCLLVHYRIQLSEIIIVMSNFTEYMANEALFHLHRHKNTHTYTQIAC